VFGATTTVAAQQPSGAQPASTPARPASGAPAAATAPAAGVPEVPPDYVIGPDDVLAVVFWRDKDLSGEVIVRPDGMISLPLMNDIQAAGLTPEQLRDQVTEAASKFVEEPNATVVVKAINSRKVFIMGNVGKPGPYPMSASMNVMQFIAFAGGLLEYADSKNITIMRQENGKTRYYKFNYRDVLNQKNIAQNILLKPGDTVVVP
jgi:polysaccharide export outer membrane protein